MEAYSLRRPASFQPDGVSLPVAAARVGASHVAITFVAALSLAVAGIGVAWAQPRMVRPPPSATSGVDETVGSDAVGSAIILDTTVSR